MKSLSIITYCICFYIASSIISAACLSGIFGNETYLANLPICHSFQDYEAALAQFTNAFNQDNVFSSLASVLMSGELVNLFLAFFGLLFKFITFLPDILTLFGAPEFLTTGLGVLLLICLSIGIFGLLTNRQTRYFE